MTNDAFVEEYRKRLTCLLMASIKTDTPGDSYYGQDPFLIASMLYRKLELDTQAANDVDDLFLADEDRIGC